MLLLLPGIEYNMLRPPKPVYTTVQLKDHNITQQALTRSCAIFCTVALVSWKIYILRSLSVLPLSNLCRDKVQDRKV